MLLASTIASSFFHLSYEFYRAKKYLVDAGALDRVAVDPNDFENGAIAFHINLLRSRALVTGDDGTRSALSGALAALGRRLRKHSLAFPVAARVLNVAEFVGEAAP